MASTTSSTSKEPEIHVMPAEFVGAPATSKSVATAMQQSTTIQSSTATPATLPPPVAPKGTPIAPPPKSKTSLILVAAGVVIVVGLGIGAYVILREPPKPASRQVVVSPPAPPPVATATSTPPVQPATSTPPIAPPIAPKPPLRPAIDTDVDGLTDLEEILYGSDRTKPDTDDDGFLDGNEVFHLYSPIVANLALLSGDRSVIPFADQLGRYTLLAPAGWVIDTLDATQGRVKFTAASGESFTVRAEENPQNLSVLDWYLANVSGASRAEVRPFQTKGGYAAVKPSDQAQAAYLAVGRFILVLSYDVGTEPEAHFRRTFEMLVNSLKGPTAPS